RPGASLAGLVRLLQGLQLFVHRWLAIEVSARPNFTALAAPLAVVGQIKRAKTSLRLCTINSTPSFRQRQLNSPSSAHVPADAEREGELLFAFLVYKSIIRTALPDLSVN
ncbi:MAG: hypothetical protein ACLGIW_12755, partial [Gammaproteobacteria bacterium]